jgi:Tol biopolymer transport system component
LSPDGRIIAYQRLTTKGIWLMSARTGAHIRRVVRNGSFLDWSPDSRRLLYSTGPFEFEGPSDLFSVDVRGRDLTRLSFTPRLDEFDAVWSPSGARIAFSTVFQSGDEEMHCSIWTTSATGNRLRRIHRYHGEVCGPHLSWQPLP